MSYDTRRNAYTDATARDTAAQAQRGPRADSRAAEADSDARSYRDGEDHPVTHMRRYTSL